jgi:hypothetical protein
MFTNTSAFNEAEYNSTGSAIIYSGASASMILSTTGGLQKTTPIGADTGMILTVNGNAVKVYSVGSGVVMGLSTTGNYIKTTYSPNAEAEMLLQTTGGLEKTVPLGADVQMVIAFNARAVQFKSAGASVEMQIFTTADYEYTICVGADVLMQLLVESGAEKYSEYQNITNIREIVGSASNPDKYECGAFYAFEITVTRYNEDTGLYQEEPFEITDCYLESWDDESVTQLYDCYIDGTQIGFNAPDYPGTYYLVLCIKCQYLPGLDRAKVRTGLAVGE